MTGYSPKSQTRAHIRSLLCRCFCSLLRVGLATVLLLLWVPDGTAVEFEEVWQQNGSVDDVESRFQSAVSDGMGGTILVGYHSAGSDQPDSAWAVRLASNGSKLWEQRFDGYANFGGRLYDIVELPDGNFAAVGLIRTGIGAETDGLIVRFDSNGEVIWAKSVGKEGTDRLVSVALDSDGSLFSVGRTNSDSVSWRTWLVEVDPKNGEIVQNSTLDLGYASGAISVASHPHGGVVICGWLNEERRGQDIGWVKHIDGERSTEWTKYVNSDEANLIVYDVDVGTDGDIVAVGYIAGQDDRKQAFALIIGKDGNWRLSSLIPSLPKNGGDQVLSAVYALEDHGFIAVGSFSPGQDKPFDFLIVHYRTDEEAWNVDWVGQETHEERAFAVVPVGRDEIILAGNAQPSSHNEPIAYASKLQIPYALLDSPSPRQVSSLNLLEESSSISAPALAPAWAVTSYGAPVDLTTQQVARVISSLQMLGLYFQSEDRVEDLQSAIALYQALDGGLPTGHLTREELSQILAVQFSHQMSRDGSDVGSDTFEDATLLIPKDNGFATVADWVGGTDPDDFFSFSMNETGPVQITLGRLRRDVDLALLDAMGEVLEISAHGASAGEFIETTLEPGRYFVRVHMANLGSSYVLRIGWAQYSHAEGVTGQGDQGQALLLAIEEALSSIGYFVGPIDGYIDGQGRRAISAFQAERGDQPTGIATDEQIADLTMQAAVEAWRMAIVRDWLSREPEPTLINQLLNRDSKSLKKSIENFEIYNFQDEDLSIAAKTNPALFRRVGSFGTQYTPDRRRFDFARWKTRYNSVENKPIDKSIGALWRVDGSYQRGVWSSDGTFTPLTP